MSPVVLELCVKWGSKNCLCYLWAAAEQRKTETEQDREGEREREIIHVCNEAAFHFALCKTFSEATNICMINHNWKWRNWWRENWSEWVNDWVNECRRHLLLAVRVNQCVIRIQFSFQAPPTWANTYVFFFWLVKCNSWDSFIIAQGRKLPLYCPPPPALATLCLIPLSLRSLMLQLA